MTHYPPNINNKRLAAQDPDLVTLGLIDVRREELLQRELRFEARGKTVKVSILRGPQKKPEGGKGGKKRR
ncbi:hypothetical protein SeMB42_g02138 [Synchytrium endobioticum]|uniref:Uncharacterized protein n=1 Tax=Synchytrium endobioticum TaxID=286115 RepID=A0A507CIP4_9FUNG|nr:hypothetical protein SeMB42_g06332 [Synchytrium endobioticum]TPX40679.1 hypothetical protein SeLEV6574_g06490 [Synchytrium endobioticum]TPX43908.1 hypothetical protein SeLEV6574_g04819 [Synchytrium endobioticum]TPX50731.1 hypothetical protein SeMB42_g02138 [Synchytrium endobioticum]